MVADVEAVEYVRRCLFVVLFTVSLVPLRRSTRIPRRLFGPVSLARAWIRNPAEQRLAGPLAACDSQTDPFRSRTGGAGWRIHRSGGTDWRRRCAHFGKCRDPGWDSDGGLPPHPAGGCSSAHGGGNTRGLARNCVGNLSEGRTGHDVSIWHTAGEHLGCHRPRNWILLFRSGPGGGGTFCGDVPGACRFAPPCPNRPGGKQPASIGGRRRSIQPHPGERTLHFLPPA